MELELGQFFANTLMTRIPSSHQRERLSTSPSQPPKGHHAHDTTGHHNQTSTLPISPTITLLLNSFILHSRDPITPQTWRQFPRRLCLCSKGCSSSRRPFNVCQTSRIRDAEADANSIDSCVVYRVRGPSLETAILFDLE